jgi:hypothetical protein
MQVPRFLEEKRLIFLESFLFIFRLFLGDIILDLLNKKRLSRNAVINECVEKLAVQAVRDADRDGFCFGWFGLLWHGGRLLRYDGMAV